MTLDMFGLERLSLRDVGFVRIFLGSKQKNGTNGSKRDKPKVHAACARPVCGISLDFSAVQSSGRTHITGSRAPMT